MLLAGCNLLEDSDQAGEREKKLWVFWTDLPSYSATESGLLYGAYATT